MFFICSSSSSWSRPKQNGEIMSLQKEGGSATFLQAMFRIRIDPGVFADPDFKNPEPSVILH